MFFSLLFSFLLLSLYSTAQLQQCHRRDGSVIPDLPCDPSGIQLFSSSYPLLLLTRIVANVSACCGQGFKCIDSLHCEAQNGFPLVGSCTDPTWMDPACPFMQLREYLPELQPQIPIKIPIRVTGSKSIWCLVTGNHRFNASRNTTDCHDGTTCPNARNDTCCINKQGVSVITFHNTRIIPSTVTALTSYYEAGGYTIPTTAPGASVTELPAFPSAAPSSVPSSTTTHTPSSSSGLSSGAKAGIGVGVAVGAIAVAVIALLFLLKYRKRRRQFDGQRDTPGYENMRHADGTFIAEAQGTEKHEIDGDSVRMGALKKHEIIGQPPPPAQVEMDARSPERTRFYEMDVPR